MTFQASKPFSFRKYAHDQRGVTLLLSVLLLSAITTIAFSLAVVGFAEITTSNDLFQTEPIFYYSLGVAEEGTYALKRGVAAVKSSLGSECDTNFVNYTVGTGSNVSSKTKVCNFNSNTNVEVAVPQNNYNSAVRLYAYDPNANNTSSSGYTSLTFRKTSNNGGSVQLYICPLSVDCADPTPPSNQITGWSPAGTTLAYGAPAYSAPSPTVPSEIVLINSTGPKEYVEVVSAPKGLPYLSKEAIEIQSAYGRLIRRLRVLVPLQ